LEYFYSISFYILAFLIIALSSAAIITPKPLYSVLFAVGTFWSVAALYFLLNAQFNAVAQLAIYGVGVGILLVFTLMLCEGEKYKILPLKLRDWTSPIIAFLIFACSLFYINNSLSQNAVVATRHSSFQTFAIEMLTKNFFAFEIISLLLLCAIVGIGATIKMKGTNNDR